MLIGLRLFFGLLLLAGLGCVVYGTFKPDPRWRRLGMLTLKWTLIAIFGFFAVVLAQHLLG